LWDGEETIPARLGEHQKTDDIDVTSGERWCTNATTIYRPLRVGLGTNGIALGMGRGGAFGARTSLVENIRASLAIMCGNAALKQESIMDVTCLIHNK